MRLNLNPAAFLGCLLLLPAAAAAEPSPQPLRAAVQAGTFVTDEMEAVGLDPAVTSALLELEPEGTLAVESWPVAPGVRQDVELVRFDVYAPDARIVKIEGGRAVELPRSRLAFFQGRSGEDPETRLIVTVDPDTRLLEGMAFTPEGVRELLPRGKSQGSYVVATAEALQPESGEPTWTCGHQSNGLAALSAPVELGPETAKAITSLHTATIAVDTDNELMNLKFGNNATAATNYIANLIARMSIMYERDLLIRLVQGFTILRPSTTTDPYNQSGTGGADGAKLNEFTSYWSSGCGGQCANVSRALAMMLSGKQASSTSASGIAWVGGLCSTGSGYSFTQVFKFAQDTSANDSSIVGHELGHNFGSDHTHCYSPPIDTCYNAESGCYSGGTTSCPASFTYNGVTAITGTAMSYCNRIGGCSRKEVFHPQTVAILAPIIQARVNTCIFPLTVASSGIFGNGFESGTTSSWQ
ncbi:MAG TPA: M12 family metallo-peptidase [Thermoanaerobaculia bacterium]|nr:M12 family metallo-peptidase [Thermoanaerobaculia bacterium]